MQQYLVEWRSADFHELTWLPFVVLILALLALGMFGRRRSSLTTIGLVTGSAYAALRSMRNVPLFCIFAAPILAGEVSSLVAFRASDHEPPRRLRWMLGSLIIAAALAGLLMVYSTLNNQSRRHEQQFPVGAADWILENQPSGNLYNNYHWGGYLIWRLFPAYPVFIDGRADLYGDSFMDEYVNSYYARPGWQEFLEENDVRLVLIEPGSLLAAQLSQSPEWRQVFADDLSVMFQKR
jgi:hypothetical protein